jgi:hypothetical protein
LVFKAACAAVFQNFVRLKDKGISPSGFSSKDFVAKTVGTVVSLQGANTKRESMWHSPVFICIRANRIPVSRINISDIKNTPMQVDSPSRPAFCPLDLIKLDKLLHFVQIFKSGDAKKLFYFRNVMI